MFKRVFITKEAAEFSYSFEIAEKTGLKPEVIPDELFYRQNIEPYMNDSITEGKTHLLLTVFRGDFFRKCPGTKGKICCNYYVIDQTTNCPYDCSYCFLQSYLTCRAIRFAVNLKDLEEELHSLLSDRGIVRVGTGELSDSLALEPFTGFGAWLVNVFSRFPNAILELKTKSANISTLPDISSTGQRAVVGWTIAPDRVINHEEINTASFHERLNASLAVKERGYDVAFHMDPSLFYENAAEEYEKMIEMIFEVHEKVIWMSLAGFRFEPDLKQYIERRFPESILINGEFIKGSDNKFRYIPTERIRFYKKIIKKVELLSPETPLYFCMEDKRMWDIAFSKDKIKEQKMRFLFS